MGTQSLHMRIGEGFHNIMINVARDHLSSFNHKKAINVFVEGMGMPVDMAIQVIKGELGLTTNVEEQVVEICDVCDNWFDNEFKGIIKHKVADVVGQFVYTHSYLVDILKKFVYDKVGRNGGKKEVLIEDQFIDIVTYLNGGVVEYKSPHKKIIENAKKIINELNNFNNLCVFGLDVDADVLVPMINSSLEIFNSYDRDIELSGMVLRHVRLWGINNVSDIKMELMLSINHLTNYDYNNAKSYVVGSNPVSQLVNVENYIETIEKLDGRDLTIPVHTYSEVCDSDAVNSLKNTYDAYWINTNGDCYGASGNKAAYLHITMAEDIVPKLYPKYKEGEDGDKSYYLESKGWVKISDDLVLFVANRPRINYGGVVEYKDEPPITQEQKEMIMRIMIYGRVKDTFRIGYDMQVIDIRRFKEMDRFMINELFKL